MGVEILMSTYNGERFISEQLDSIVNQTVSAHITVRDDGSTDSTLDIIKKYNDISLIKGSNVGSTESFLRLIEVAPENDYYAFCDQDDLWDQDKLECAINMLDKYNSIPAIYSSNTRFVDKELVFIKNEEKKPRIDLGSAIVKNYATGCTVVFNGLLMNELKKKHPDSISYHDWWANLVCLSVGGVSLFDMTPHISYRQHGDNSVGGNESLLKKWNHRLKRFKSPYHRDNMAKQLLDIYSNKISDENKELLRSLINGKFDKRLQTGNMLDDILFRVCFMLKKY